MASTLWLDGKSLSVGDVAEVARGDVQVAITPERCKRIENTRNIVLEMANDPNMPRIYGFNTGLGVNKDWTITPEIMEAFNRDAIRSHSAAVAPEASEEEVRAMLLVRLNCFLNDATGVQPELIYMYRDMLNQRVHPVLPKRGSIGESDLVVMAHIGQAIIGEGDVFYKGERMPAKEGLEKAGLKPIVLGSKGALAIVNTSALGSGVGSLLLQDTLDFLDTAELLYALILEGYGANTSPLDPAAHAVRPVPGPAQTAALVRKYLEGSFLWQGDVATTFQDPLSFRSGCHVLGALRDALGYVMNLHAIQINCSDDNPCVLADEKRIISCSNYDPTSLALGFEMLGLALAHVSKNSCNQLIRLGTPYFSRLNAFLSPGPGVMAYITNQKTYTSIDTENRLLANPVTLDFATVSGDVEDHATNLPLIVNKTQKILDNLRYIAAHTAIHAAQAIDLRKRTPLGAYTSKAYEAIREVLPFLEKDRIITNDIRTIYELVESNVFTRITKA